MSGASQFVSLSMFNDVNEVLKSMRINYLKNPVQRTLGALFVLSFLSACSDSDTIAKDITVASEEQNTEVTNPTNVVASTIDYTSFPSTIISGDIAILSDGLPVGGVVVKVRGSDAKAIRQDNGSFNLVVDASDTEQEVILDIFGDNVVEKSVALQIPANAENAILNTTVATRTPPITFNLDVGGDLRNADSSTRTTVTVPANAFQFLDGSAASGMAEVNITELNILDLEADSSWAPNFIGIPEGSSESRPITTYGMSEFHFSQNGRELDLRAGVNATLSIDLALPYISTSSDNSFVTATAGATQPLWHYDIEDLVWKEEGQVTISADTESATGFVAKGDVAHFSFWNIDYVTPFLDIDVNIRVIDENGNPRNDVEVLTYDTFVGIPADEGPEYNGNREGLSTWNNSKVLTPQNKFIQIIGNTTESSDGERRVGRIDMNVIVNDVTSRNHGVISSGEMVQRRFFEVGGDSSVYFDVVMPNPQPPEPTAMSTDVIVELVDLLGNPVQTFSVKNYTVSATADNGWTSYNTLLTPRSRRLTVQGNSPEYLGSSSQPVSTEVTLVDVTLENVGEIDLIKVHSESKVFKTVDSNNVVIFSVPVVDF